VSSRKRLSICYAAPGQNLFPSAGPTRNVLNLANALSQWAEVTVAFRNIQEPIVTSKYKVIAIEPDGATSTGAQDDNATRGLHPFRHVAYCRKLWSFSQHQANSYDVVLEKGWRLSGYLLDGFRQRGVPGVLVENNVHFWNDPLTNFEAVAKYVFHSASHQVASRCSRRASAVIAETEEMKTMLVEHRKLPADQIEVVGLGVDHTMFRPMDQQSARESLQISSEAVVLLYVGGMDEYHDLEPVIEALAPIRQSSVELHLVGDGEYRQRCEEKAKRTQISARFHGHVSHSMVPQYIAAADLCIAPYRTSACYNGILPFSTLKIPEYMACARPVVSVPSGSIQRLVEDRVSGFLFPNDVSSWRSFLKKLPSRKQLASMGRAAAQAADALSWDKTARSYLQVCERLSRKI
jgi:glycosyltransferase involved in cell wall biosynthesis